MGYSLVLAGSPSRERCRPNRTWEEEGDKPGNTWKMPDFFGWLNENRKRYMDDDVLGDYCEVICDAERR